MGKDKKVFRGRLDYILILILGTPGVVISVVGVVYDNETLSWIALAFLGSMISALMLYTKLNRKKIVEQYFARIKEQTPHVKIMLSQKFNMKTLRQFELLYQSLKEKNQKKTDQGALAIVVSIAALFISSVMTILVQYSDITLQLYFLLFALGVVLIGLLLWFSFKALMLGARINVASKELENTMFYLCFSFEEDFNKKGSCDKLSRKRKQQRKNIKR